MSRTSRTTPVTDLAAAAPVAAPPSPLTADLEQELLRLAARAHAAFPEVALQRDVFLRFLTEAVRAQLRTSVAQGGLCVEDLFLVCAYSQGSPAATRALEGRYLPPVRGRLARMGLQPAHIQDIWHLLLQRLLGGARSGAGAYTGRGTLKRWLQVAAVREAIRLGRRAARHISIEDSELIDQLQTPDAPDLRIMKQRYRDSFRAAFLEALQLLSPRQRNLLRHYYLDRLGVTEIGRLHGVNPATAWRWLERCRQEVFLRTREALRQRVTLSDPDFDSLARIMQSQVNLSLRSLLQEGS